MYYYFYVNRDQDFRSSLNSIRSVMKAEFFLLNVVMHTRAEIILFKLYFILFKKILMLKICLFHTILILILTSVKTKTQSLVKSINYIILLHDFCCYTFYNLHDSMKVASYI